MPLRSFLLLFALPLFANSPVGLWKTIDDETGKTKSIVEISENSDGSLEGRVIEILHSDLGPDPLCEKCPGERKGKPIKGMTILWDMKSKGETWSGGQILDPKNGKVYRCKIEILETGKLEVRGYLGISLFGRSQRWDPVED